MNKVYNIDFLDNELPDKCAQLIIADPPYYKVKGEFDFIWNSFEDYLKDVEKWAIECKRILSDNGTLFWYGDAKNIAYAQIIFDKYFNLLNSIVWENTNDHKQQIRFNEDLRTFAPLTERILMYEQRGQKTGGEIVFEQFLKPNGSIPTKISAIPLTEVALEMVAANFGIMCMPKWVLKYFVKPSQITLKRLEQNELTRTHYLIYRKINSTKKYIQNFVFSVQEHFTEQIDA